MSDLPASRRALPLFLLAALASACAETMPPAPAAPAPPPVVAREPVAPAPPPVVAPPPAASQNNTGARLQLVPAQAEIKLGTRAALALTNVDDHAFRYHHPGGTNGCDAFRWRVTLIDARGRAYADHYEGLNRTCTTVMVPESWITIEPGRSAPVYVDTGVVWYEVGRMATVDRDPSRGLAPGSYDVVVGTPMGEVRGKIRILSRG